MSEADGPRRPPRWGLRAAGFITLAFVALGTAQLQGFHTLGTAICAAIGLVAGTYCSVRGVLTPFRLPGKRGG